MKLQEIFDENGSIFIEYPAEKIVLHSPAELAWDDGQGCANILTVEMTYRKLPCFVLLGPILKHIAVDLRSDSPISRLLLEFFDFMVDHSVVQFIGREEARDYFLSSLKPEEEKILGPDGFNVKGGYSLNKFKELIRFQRHMEKDFFDIRYCSLEEGNIFLLYLEELFIHANPRSYLFKMPLGDFNKNFEVFCEYKKSLSE